MAASYDGVSQIGMIAGTALALVLAAAQVQDGRSATPREPWNARAVEHLLNRAAFGASTEEVLRIVEGGRPLLFARLFAPPSGDSFDAQPIPIPLSRDELAGLAVPERRALRNSLRYAENDQLTAFTAWWFARMLDGPEPLRERMCLFWHGHFATSARFVKISEQMIVQHETIRRHALGSFRELLHAMVRDPALLRYLNNNTNTREHPNENFARELMELHTLGVGQFSERDVREAARSLTGWHVREREFLFDPLQHDDGVKTILGSMGRFGAEELVDLLLEQEQTSRFLTQKLIRYFEGLDPDPDRLQAYAAHLRSTDYDIGRFLLRLFRDPAFYRDAARGTRVASPVDFLVGSCRRLGVRPPTRFFAPATGVLGERLFFPPSVRGWPGGWSWLNASTVLQRANLAGVLAGTVRADDLMVCAPEIVLEVDSSGEAAMRMRESPSKWYQALQTLGEWEPELSSCPSAEWDEAGISELAQSWLAVELEPSSRAALLDFWCDELADCDAEQRLRRFAHAVLSLPEAQFQ